MCGLAARDVRILYYGDVEVAVQSAVKPNRIALGRKKNLNEAFRGRMPQSREIDNVPTVGEQNPVAAVLREFLLQQFRALLVPLQRQAIVGGRLQVVLR